MKTFKEILTEAANFVKIIPIEEGEFDYINDDESEAWSKLDMFIVNGDDLDKWASKNKADDFEDNNKSAEKLTIALQKKKIKSKVKKIKVDFSMTYGDPEPSTKEKDVIFIYPEI